MCIFFGAKMEHTILDMQKMPKKDMKCTKKVKAPDTLEFMSLKNWFTLKPLKPVAMPCDGNAKSKNSVMTKNGNLYTIMGALKLSDSQFIGAVWGFTSF
jgi:hypothetical protein